MDKGKIEAMVTKFSEKFAIIMLKKHRNSSKHQYKAEFKNLDDSEFLSGTFSGLRTSVASLTSMASATSTASTPSKALFH